MMAEPQPVPEMTIADVLEQWPQTATVFQRYQMACVGCVLAPFYTLADAIQIYDVDCAAFLAELRELAATSSPSDGK